MLASACVGAETLKPEFELAAGLSHDSSLVVEEIDFSRETADEALNLEASVSLAGEWDNGLMADMSFSLADSNYQEVDEFDLRTSLLLFSLAYDIQDITANLTCYRSDASLGGSDYLSLTSCSPTASYFVNSHVYVQGGFTHTGKNFNQESARDADNLKTFGSAWYFFDSIEHYMSVSLAHRSEDANAREYDYSGNEVEFSWVKVNEFIERDLRVKLGVKFENRAYKRATDPGNSDGDNGGNGNPGNGNPGNGNPGGGDSGGDDVGMDNASARKDDRREFFSEIKMDLSERTWVELIYRYSQNDSTEAAVEYDQNSLELLMGIRF